MKQSPKKIAASFIQSLEKKDADEVNKCISDLDLISLAVKYLRLVSRFKNPSLDRKRKEEILSSVAEKIGAGESAIKIAFSLLLLNQLSDLPKVVSAMKDVRLSLFGVGEGDVTTATPLTDRQRKESSEILRKIGGYKEAIVTEHVNPHILGGIKIAAADKLIDATLQKQIKNMLKMFS